MSSLVPMVSDPNYELIKSLYDKLKSLLKARESSVNEDNDHLKIVEKAFEWAKKAHNEMFRKSGEPYIIHPLEVSIICVESLGLDYVSVVCALLHDVVEDSDASIKDIYDEFGGEIANIIEGLTKIKIIVDRDSVKHDNKAMREKAESLMNLLKHTVSDVRVLLIKLADRLHNMRTLEVLRHDKQIRIASETQVFYAPMAHRLGMNAIKQELDDLSFKYTGKEYYFSILDQLDNELAIRKKHVKEFIEPLIAEFNKYNINCEFIIKNKPLYYIYNNMKEKKLVSVSELDDLLSLRMILNVKPEGVEERIECWKAYAVLTSLYELKPGETTDWISAARSNGYKAIHTTVMGKNGRWMDVQVMSRWMNDVAERGFAAYYTERKESKDSINVNNWLRRINEILFESDESINYDEVFNDVKGFLYDTDIFVYAEDGERRILPKGSTVLDFAFALGNDIGLKCSAAFVNHKLRSKSHVLSQGEQIKIIESNDIQIDESLLEMVITTRAKRIIKSKLYDMRNVDIEKGHEQFENCISLVKSDSTDNILPLILDSWYPDGTENDFYFDMSHGKRTIDDINALIKKSNSTFFGRLNPLNLISTKNKKCPTKKNVGENNNKKHKLAACCFPIPGDSIVAIDDGDSIVYHRSNCHHALEYYAISGKGIVKDSIDPDMFKQAKAVIELTAPDRAKLLEDIMNVISSKENVILDELKIQADEGIAKCEITISVPYVNVLEDIIKSLCDISGKVKAYRKMEI